MGRKDGASACWLDNAPGLRAMTWVLLYASFFFNALSLIIFGIFYEGVPKHSFLVGRVVHSAGYNLFNFTRAFSVVNRQSASACFLLRSASQASTSSFSIC